MASGSPWGFSLWASVITAYFAAKAKSAQTAAEASAKESVKHLERANAIALGAEDAATYARIASTRERVENLTAQRDDFLDGRKVANLNAQEKRKLERIADLYGSALENYLNTYDVACGQFLDDKVDKVRFKKNHAKAIQNIVESKDGNYRRHLDPEGTSSCKCLWLVYREFHDHERNG